VTRTATLARTLAASAVAAITGYAVLSGHISTKMADADHSHDIAATLQDIAPASDKTVASLTGAYPATSSFDLDQHLADLVELARRTGLDVKAQTVADRGRVTLPTFAGDLAAQKATFTLKTDGTPADVATFVARVANLPQTHQLTKLTTDGDHATIAFATHTFQEAR
jgi:hypothetical protein